MDYINYVKQSPVQGLTGLYGGVQGSLMAASSGGGEILGEQNYFGGRGIYTSSPGEINYWSISSTGNAANFGDIPQNSAYNNGGFCGDNSNRAIFGGGPSNENAFVYITTTSTGNAQTFGSLNQGGGRYHPAGCSNGPRGVLGGGQNNSGNMTHIEYVTCATTGSAADFGERTESKHGVDSISGGTRGIWANGQDPHSVTIDYVTIANTGNATDFGDTTTARTHGCGTNSDSGTGQVRGVFMAGHSSVDDHCDYIAISTPGNATDWGELARGHGYRCGAGTDGTRGFIAGGQAGPSEITYLTIDTTASSTTAGDLSGTGTGCGSSGEAS